MIPSRPARGAWIEIKYGADMSYKQLSRPARGAWIEIHVSHDDNGLTLVAPRKGRVD